MNASPNPKPYRRTVQFMKIKQTALILGLVTFGLVSFAQDNKPDPAPTNSPPAAPEPVTYEAAAARVEEIIRRLDSGDASLSETLELVSEGKALIELCARELEAVGNALEELRLDELVKRLENEAAG